MTPLIPCSISNISPIPVTAFTIKNNCLTRHSTTRKYTKHTISTQRFVLPLPSVRYFLQYPRGHAFHHKSGHHILSATGINVAVEESDSPAVDEGSAGTSGTPSDVQTSETSSTKSDASPAPAQSRQSRTTRKSEMPSVKNEELIPGAMFTGKVRSIQPFGAFVDFGAFTDGLVHVSRLSDSFVKDVGSFVSVGQEVKVRLIEANTETGRISLTMREKDDISKVQQQKDVPASSEKARPGRWSTSKPGQRREGAKTTKFVKGQDLEGTVKNMTRSGAFISLPEGEEGFLPTSEESDDGLANMMGGSSLQVGQEVSVRVLRITRGQVTLTMKKEEDAELDLQLTQGVVHAATNPFVLAFRKNKDIAAYLDERDKAEKAAKNSEAPKTPKGIEGKVNQSETGSSITQVQDQPGSSDEVIASIPPAVDETVEEDNVLSKDDEVADIANEDAESIVSSSSESLDGAPEKETEENTKTLAPEGSLSTENQIIEEVPSTDLSGEIAEQVLSSDSPKEDEVADIANEDAESIVSGSSESLDGAPEKETEENTKTLAPEGSLSTENLIIEEVPSTDLSGEIAEQVLSSDSPKKDEVDYVANEGAESIVSGSSASLDGAPEKETEENTKTLAPEGSLSTENQIIEEVPSTDLSGEIAEQVLSSDSPKVGEVIKNQTDDAASKDELQIQTTAAEEKDTGEITETLAPEANASTEKQIIGEATSTDLSGEIAEQVSSSEGPKDEEVVESQTDNATAKDEEQILTPTADNETTSATISPALVKQLREETGAGMMDCKKALAESGGDIVKAQEFLRKKGLASAEKKASRATAEGRIGSYIHDSRIGVLVEVNCETDFVSRGNIFKELVDDLAMQVAACPQVKYLVTEDVPEEIVNKEKEIEMQKEDLLSKPEQIRSKIVEGRIRKRLEELALLEQPYIKNDKMVVKDWVKQTIATIGENIKVKRFVRYNLGEGLEKKSQDFAAEVAAQTAAKPVAKDQPAPAETKETVEKPAAVAVSAALVKQLREETGAGMMDCKKALSETGGDLEKAQEYLRKKGLSTADKKSSRLAAEGRIGAYIHDSRIGVLIEVNCETDFVGRSEKFKELVDDLAMQVVACPQVQFVSIEDIPEHIASKEKELEMQREDLLSKPENIRERIVEGRVSKRLGELVLLEQPFVKNDNLLVKDLIKQTVAAIGENIKVRRFVRFTLGEKNEDTAPGTEA